ncbi:MAG: PEP-CTERM sorting domain-containing protein [Pseudomonadales bacterium]
MIKKIVKGAALGAALLLASGTASAHVWQIGWKALNDGSVNFYGVSWHGGGISPGVANSVDDFAANPAGVVINGTNVTFDIGQVFDLNDCIGLHGTSGTCSPIWNSLGLDDALASTLDQTGDTYGKYALVNLDTAELAAVGIGQGSNSVLLTTFSPNVHWAARPFASGTIPINIVVLPPTNGNIPVPATLGLMGLGLAALGMTRRRAKK